MLFELVVTLLYLTITTNSLCAEGEFEFTEQDSLEIICKVCPDGQITGHTKKHSCQVVHDTERTCEAGTYGFKVLGCVECPPGTHSPAGAVKIQECTSVTEPRTDSPINTDSEQQTTKQKAPTSHNSVTETLTNSTRNITAQKPDQTSRNVPTNRGPTLAPVSPTHPTAKKDAQIALIVALLFMLIAGTISAAYICWRRAVKVENSKDLPLVEPARFSVRLSNISSCSDVFEEEKPKPDPTLTSRSFGRQNSNYVTTDELERESEYVESRIPSKYEVLAVNVSVGDESGLTEESAYVNTGQIGARGVPRQESQYVYANPFLECPEMSPTNRKLEESEYINSNPRESSTLNQPEYVTAHPAGTQPESEYVYSDKEGADTKKSEYVNTGLEDSLTAGQEEEESAYSYTSHGALRSLRNVPARAAKSRGQVIRPGVLPDGSEYVGPTFQGTGIMPDGSEYVGPTFQGTGIMPDGSEYVGPTFQGTGIMPDGSEYVGPTFNNDLYENQDGIYSQCKNSG
ncbi:hypothetical protein ACHWQZ_G005846 [Mnemiopsis leidyi]